MPQFSPPEEAASLSQCILIIPSVCSRAAIKIYGDIQQPVSDMKFNFDIATRQFCGKSVTEKSSYSWYIVARSNLYWQLYYEEIMFRCCITEQQGNVF